MKPRNRSITLMIGLAAVIVCFFGLSVLPAFAKYDEQKCKSSVKMVQKLIKGDKTIRFKELLEQLDQVAAKEGGWSAEELEAFIDAPFEDMSWVKKFIKYMDEMEESCSQ